MKKNPPIDRDVVASIDILWSCPGWRHSREKGEMDRWKIRTDSARENTIPLLWSRGGECSGRASWKRWNLTMSMILARDAGTGVCQASLTENRKGKGRVVGFSGARTGLKGRFQTQALRGGGAGLVWASSAVFPSGRLLLLIYGRDAAKWVRTSCRLLCWDIKCSSSTP